MMLARNKSIIDDIERAGIRVLGAVGVELQVDDVQI
jgi:hypothetical protein